MQRTQLCAAAIAAIGIASAAGADHHEGTSPHTAHAVLRDGEGAEVGRAALHETAHGVLLHVRLEKAASGTHAFHIHERGRCEPPSFTSAGGHFNPTGREHGIASAGGPHAGDLPNVFVPPSGQLQFEFVANGVTLADGDGSLFDADGSALVLHAGPDDYETDPSGNAGDRIACGVVERGSAAE